MQKITELIASRPINVNNQAQATAEGKVMNESNDQSRNFTVGNIGGDFKPIGSVIQMSFRKLCLQFCDN
jgi:hypothetical protein